MTDEAYYRQGFDIDAARRRFLGKREMYERFLLRFPEDSNYRKMQKALKENNIKSAFYHAHTLKGVCGNLSLYRLYEASGEIVEELRKDKLPDEEMFAGLRQCYEETLLWIEKIRKSGIPEF